MNNGFSPSSLNSTRKPVMPSLQRDSNFERTPYLNPVSVTKGTMLATLGGITEVRDTTGGTVLFTIDPTTGTVTIAGGIVANQTVNLGTVYNSVLSGTLSNIGTLSLGIGTAGTIYNSTWSGGTITGNKFTSGTIIFTNFSNGTLDGPRIISTPIFDIAAGSSTISTSGGLNVQTFGTGPVIVINSGGTSFRFTPNGTI